MNVFDVLKSNNIDAEIVGDTLVMRVDLTQELGLSSSGKTTLVASSRGNKVVEFNGENIYVGINLYKK